MSRLNDVFAVLGLLMVIGILSVLLYKGITPGDSNEDNSNTYQTIPEFMESGTIKLPEPLKSGGMSLNEALALRRSSRSYTSESLSLVEISQILWSAQGVTSEAGYRTAPSAGATFPLEIFVVSNRVKGLAKGIYKYHPSENQLKLLHEKDISVELMKAARDQEMITDAAFVVIFGAIFQPTTDRYGDRGIRYVYNEAGHASQNVHLMAAALGLGTVVIGSYIDDEVEKILGLDESVRVLYMMPVGITP